MSDPFLITEPTCISFSGGRTSAYMLWRALQSNGGLPDGSVCLFANTGKEEEATLRFVRDCSHHWNVPITWIEYRDNEQGYAVVDFDTASRNGEPFEAIIRKRNYLPNPVTRFCTSELKVLAMEKHLVTLLDIEIDIDGADSSHFVTWVGIRADEMRRLHKIGIDRAPLAAAGVTIHDVQAFWSAQPFNLELLTVNGRTLSGNCDLCFLKGPNQIQSLIAQKPDRAVWWAQMEALALASKPSGARFRNDRPSYAEMMKRANEQTDMFGHDDESIACFCGD